MKKGDLAFFYHSSCKVPAIVGLMEIVKEHTPDRMLPSILSPDSYNLSPLQLVWPQSSLTIRTVTAHDPSAPYYDPKSKPEEPKWSVVHVEFRQKLDTPITLKEMKEWQSTKGNPLENMQMLKLSRLSVSAVREEEWKFLTGVMEKNGETLVVK
jgi:predicted RNA-binding protein with PUA-like domain